MTESPVMRWSLFAAVASLMSGTLPSAVSQSSGSEDPIQIRLVGGKGPHEGNVQVMVNGGDWGHVCDDNFRILEAHLVCRHLGYEGAAKYTLRNAFAQPVDEKSGTRLVLRRFFCSANVTSIVDCRPDLTSTFDSPRCSRIEVAGVECLQGSFPCTDPTEFPCEDSNCVDGDYVCDSDNDCLDASDEAPEMCKDVAQVEVINSARLTTNIPGAKIGTIKVKYRSHYGSICDNDFDRDAAKVFCRDLGFQGDWSVDFFGSYLGENTGDTVLDRFICRGTERTIADCFLLNWGRSTCPSDERAGVFCYDGEVNVRLVEGTSRDEGRVELQLGGEWGSLCDTGFDIHDAQVLCNMLGYTGEAISYRGAHFGQGNRIIWNIGLDCVGTELTLQSCRITFLRNTCPQSRTAGITCTNSPATVGNALRSMLPQDCGQPVDASTQFLTGLGKVRGGIIPTRFDAPWLASLRRRSEGGPRLSCGASIISEDYLVTAAHCFRLIGRLHLVVRVGDYNSDYKEDGEEDFFIDKIWTHENFEEGGFGDNDFALVKIERKHGRGIRFGHRVKPICLPDIRDSYEDLSGCTVAGWGEISLFADTPSLPRSAKLSILSDDICLNRYGTVNHTSAEVCVGNLTSTIKPCSGDSGGPLFCKVAGRQILYGVVSTSGRICDFRRDTATFARVTRFIRWMYNIIAHGRRN